MKFKKYTVFVVVLLLSVLHSTGLQELESVLDEKTQTQQFVSYDCAKRAFGRIKGGIEYLLPFITSAPNYLMGHTVSLTFSVYSNFLKYMAPTSREVLIHNMLVKFHPYNSHKLNQQESDFMKCITPAEQASVFGGELFFVDTSGISGNGVYNPSIIKYNDKLYSAFRVQGNSNPSTLLAIYKSHIVLAEMSDDFKVVSHYPLVSDNIKLHEDARLTIFKGDLYASYVTVTPHMFGAYSACMEIGKFAQKEQVKNVIRPNISNNTNFNSLQKNWLFFEKDDRLLAIYSIDPMFVYDITVDPNAPKEIVKKKKIIKEWPFGPVRSSTNPIWIEEENKYLSFYHSDLKTIDGIREYFVGALLFDNDFNITHYSKKPLFISTPHVKRFIAANTILPYGCIRQGDNLILSVGINDKAAAIMKLPVKTILNNLSAL